jgi:hypothetical protein
MEWLNLHSSTLDSAEFVGAEPTQRSTWLCLLRFCIGQENEGRIVGAAHWGDRRWQQLVRVTRREIMDTCDLWRTVGDDVEVNFYPLAKQREIESKRQAGRDTVAKRWMQQGENGGSSANSSATCSAPPFSDTEGKGRGKEGKGKEEEGADPTPPASRRTPKLSDDEWMESLKSATAYAGIDIAREHSKATVWCQTRGITLSRKRFVNWLNRADKPMSGTSNARGLSDEYNWDLPNFKQQPA